MGRSQSGWTKRLALATRAEEAREMVAQGARLDSFDEGATRILSALLDIACSEGDLRLAEKLAGWGGLEASGGRAGMRALERSIARAGDPKSPPGSGEPAALWLVERMGNPDKIFDKPAAPRPGREPLGFECAPILKAAEHGSLAIVRALLATGADPDRRNRLGETALIAAAESAHPNAAQIAMELLRAGADPWGQDGENWCALDTASNDPHDPVAAVIESWIEKMELETLDGSGPSSRPLRKKNAL